MRSEQKFSQYYEKIKMLSVQIDQILIIRRIIESIKANCLPIILLFNEFSKAIDSIYQEKYEGYLASICDPLGNNRYYHDALLKYSF